MSHHSKAGQFTGTFLLLLLLFGLQLSAQQRYVFSHLTTANGLSGNNIQSVAADKNGYLWIATTEGLNRYDGYTITSYRQAVYPGLPAGRIETLFCDSKNRVWVSGSNGLAVIDAARNIHAIQIASATDFSATTFIETENNSIIACSRQTAYALSANAAPGAATAWQPLPWLDAVLRGTTIRDIAPLGHDRYIVIAVNKVLVINFSLQQQEFAMELPYAWSGCRITDDKILVASQRGVLHTINIKEQKIAHSFLLPADDHDRAVSNTSINKVREITSGEIMITTMFKGMYIFDVSTAIFQPYRHDPLNNSSISDNRTENIFSDSAGNIFLTTGHTGLNICNTRYYKASYIPSFTDGKGNIYDGYINDVAADARRNILWMAAFDRLIAWDEKKQQARFYPCYKKIDGLGQRALEVKSVCIDHQGRIWAGVYEQGVLLLNEKTGQYRLLTQLDTLHKNSPLNSDYIHDILEGPDGNMWCCSGKGVFTIDPVTLRVNDCTAGTALSVLNGKRVLKIFCDSRKRLWFATQQNGAYCYDVAAGTLSNVPAKDNWYGPVYNFGEDSNGDIFIATSMGLLVLDSTGKTTLINNTNGLKSNICQGILPDREGRLWIANSAAMISYVPQKKFFKYYGNESGLYGWGLINGSAHQSAGGTLYWGTEKGLLYFEPGLMRTPPQPLHVNISQVQLADTTITLTGRDTLQLRYLDNSVSFYFSAIDLSSPKNIFYRYMLEGFDKKWTEETDITMAKYTALSPGNYTFRVKASKDGINWTDAAGYVHVHIALPFWKRWWFILLCCTCIAGALFLMNKMVVRRRKADAALRINYERKIATMEMNTLRAQMNPHFIFNSLNSINTFILKNDQENASEYLNKFSQLVRLILDNSRNDWVLLENELKALRLYIELEALRFDHMFSYVISISPDIKTGSVQVPPLIIQPYAENAIRHGLMNRKEPGGKISINVWKENEELLIQIEDNGIGRKKAAQMNSKKNALHQSHGMNITAERIAVINEVYKVHAEVQVTDLEEGNDGQNSGTRILLTIQYKTNAGHNH